MPCYRCIELQSRATFSGLAVMDDDDHRRGQDKCTTGTTMNTDQLNLARGLVRFRFPVFQQSLDVMGHVVENVNLRSSSTVIILRGLPGSGKTTMAAELAYLSQRIYGRPTRICSADEYLYNDQGDYEWSRERVVAAHNCCFDEFKESLDNNVFTVIVDNTNIRHDEYEPYAAEARLAGYCVVFVTFRCTGFNNALAFQVRTQRAVPRLQLQHRYEQYIRDYRIAGGVVVDVDNQEAQDDLREVQDYFIW
jgi:predicted kinase